MFELHDYSMDYSNTMPQLEQSSLQPSSDLHHRHLLQTTSYNHLLLLHVLISRKGNLKQQQARNPPPPPRRGLRSQKGLRPFNPLQRRSSDYMSSTVFTVIKHSKLSKEMKGSTLLILNLLLRISTLEKYIVVIY